MGVRCVIVTSCSIGCECDECVIVTSCSIGGSVIMWL